MSKNQKIITLYYLSVISLIGLIFLNLIWEIFFNPLDSGGSWMVVKSLILLIPLPGILSKNRYTYQWSSMFIWLFIMEGIVRFYSESGISGNIAAFQIFLGSIFFFSSIFFCKVKKK